MFSESINGARRRAGTLGLLLLVVMVAVAFGSAALAAPPAKTKSVATESGSGSLQAYGFNVVDDAEFVYPEVRHVSLTIAYYSEDEGAPADLFAGPVWADDTRSKAVWTTQFTALRHEDDFDYILDTKTVEFDADRWLIELRSLSAPVKWVRYNYTVTYPKP